MCLKTISNLPNRRKDIFFPEKDFAIYVLDNYAVHLMPEVRKALLEKGYVLIIMGGGITGYIQLNDTDLHHCLKAHYRQAEMALMLQKLEIDSKSTPKPSREEMIKMLLEAWKEAKKDFSFAFKRLFVTSALDGSEDFLVSDKLMSLIGESMKKYRSSLLKQKVPGKLINVMKNLILPKGIKRNKEGYELLDFYDEDVVEVMEEEESCSEDEIVEVEQSEDDEEPHAEENQESGILKLTGICANDEINADARFLDALGEVLHKFPTTDLMIPQRNRIEAAFYDGRRAVKKRIEREQSKTDEEEGE